MQEAMNASAEFPTLLKAGCLMNPDLYGFGVDATIPACRRCSCRSDLSLLS